MTTGTRTSSSIEPSFGLRSKTSMPPMMSAAGGVKDALMLNVPRAGAPALAVAIPDAITPPAASTMRHWSAASNTLALPVMVTGDVTRALVSGAVTVMPPFDDVIGVGAGEGLGRTVGVELVVVTAVGVGDGVTIAPPHAPASSARTSSRLTLRAPER